MIVLVQHRKKSVLTLLNQIENVLSVYITMVIEGMYMDKTEVCRFESRDNKSWYYFCLRSISKDLTKDELSKISLNGTVYDFSVNHSPIGKEDILNIHEYLI